MEAILSLPPIAPKSKKLNPTQEIAAAFEITTGRILKIMVTAWSGDRTSYRISVEQNGQLTIVHRLRSDRETITVNDLLWQLAGGSQWRMRPGYSGAGFILFHGDYSQFISRENACAELAG